MIPNLFSKRPLPDSLPEGMLELIEGLKQCKGKEDCLKYAYGILTGKYRGYKLRVYFRFWELFRCDPFYWWPRSGFMNCTNLNYMLRTLLVKSGRFSESGIVPKLTVLYISPHQYFKVRVSKDRWVDVDCWAKAYGIGFGDYARGFNC
ncbi:MAG: hypothetical protein KKD17_02005 [Nanoarchaeota archaeon]|nr:hypothetical protein [Nanoarchaeota archaeon]